MTNTNFFWHLNKNLTCTWAFNHPNDVFYFQNVSEINGIHVPFYSAISIAIHGLFRWWWGISMDATFGTNYINFHLLTLLVFDTHHTKMSIAWIITNHQICNDLVEWLTHLKKKLLRKNPKWKPSCVMDANDMEFIHDLY